MASRWLRRLLIPILCAGALVALAHTPWARAQVLSRLVAAFTQRTGYVFSATGLDYNLFRLTATVEGLQIARPGTGAAPLLRVRRVTTALARAALSGVPEVEWIDAEGLSLVLDLRDSGPSTHPFAMPAFTVGRASLRHIDVEVIAPDGVGHLAVRDAALELTGVRPRHLEGSIIVAGGLTLDSPDARVRIDRFEGRGFLDGETIGVRPAFALAGLHRLDFDGQVTVTGPAPAFALGVAGGLDAALLAEWVPALAPGRGPVQIEGRVTGALSDPTLTVLVQTAGIEWPEIVLPPATVEATLTRTGLEIARARASVGRGWIEVVGRSSFGEPDPVSQFSLTWADVSTSDLARLVPREGIAVADASVAGSARLEWPGVVPEPTLVSGEGTLTIGLAPGLPPARVTLAGRAGRWRLRGEQRLEGDTRAILDVSARLDAAEFSRGPAVGSLRVTTRDLASALAQARRAFPGLPDAPAWLEATPLTLDGRIDGTLGSPRLTATVEGLQIGRPGAGAAPLLRVRRITTALARNARSGVPQVEWIDAEGLSLVLDLRDSGPSSRPFAMPAFTVGRASLRHIDVEVIAPDGVGHLAVRDAALELTGVRPRHLEGSIVVAGGLTLDSPDARVRIDRFEGRGFLDGETIGVRPAFALAGPHRLDFDGQVTVTGPAPAFALGVAGGLDAALLAEWVPALAPGRGPVQIEGRVTGALSDPTVTVSLQTAGLEWPEIVLPPATVEATLTRTGLEITRARASVGHGWIEVVGRSSFGEPDPVSQVSLTWADVSTSDLARLVPGEGIAVADASVAGWARLEWPGVVPEPTLVSGEGTLTIGLAPGLPPARVALAGQAGRWRLHGEQGLEGDTSAVLDVSASLDAAAFSRSPAVGSLRVTTRDLASALAQARHAFPGLPDMPAWLEATPLTLDGRIDGTLGSPRLTATVATDRLRVHGLPDLRASAAFVADRESVVVSRVSATDGNGNSVEASGAVCLAAETTTGTVAATLRNPDALLVAAAGGSGVEVPGARAFRFDGGTLEVRGSWTGPLSDPALSLNATGSDLGVIGPDFALAHAAVEVRVDGPLSNPRGSVHVSSPELRAGTSPPVSADATVTLDGSRAQVVAHVPEWSASIDGHVLTRAPYEYAAALSLSELALARLRPVVGAAHGELSLSGTISARLDATGALEARTVRLAGDVALHGIGVVLDESPLVSDVEATLQVGEGSVWMTVPSGRAFQGPVTASGDLPMSWLEDYVPQGWHLTGGATSNRAASFEVRAEPDIAALMARFRPEDPQHTFGTLRVRVTGEAPLPSLRSLQGRVVLDPGTFTIRDVAFSVPRAVEIAVQSGRASVEGATVTAPGTTMSLSGSVDLLGEQALEAELSASGALGFLSSFVPGRTSGTVNASVRAAGPADRMHWNGRVSLDAAAWVWPDQRIALRDWSGEAVIAAGVLTIERLEGLVNGGEAVVTGTLPLEKPVRPGASLNLQVRDAFAEVVRGLRTQGDVDLSLTRTGEGALLAGTVTVTSGAYREPVTAMARLLSRPPAPAATVQPATWLSTLALDVGLVATTPIVIENSAGRLDLAPNMRLVGSAAAPIISGTLDMADVGRLTLWGRTFRLREGRVAFPASGGEPSVRLVGETRIGDYAVTLRTNGPLSQLTTSYRSDPPLSERDLRSLIVTGRMADVAGTRSGDDDQFLLGTATSKLLGLAGQMVGLDSVQLGRGDFELGSTDVNPSMRLTVSRSLNARTRLVLSQDLDNNKLTWIVIFSPGRGYQVRVSQRDNVEEAIEFRQEIAFGPGVSPPRLPLASRRSTAPRVSSLEFAGNLGVPASALEAVVRLRPSRPFDAGVWLEDRARLEAFYRERGHAIARIVPNRRIVAGPTGDTVVLTYRIDAGPRTELTVRGIPIDDRRRRGLMRVWSESVLPEFFGYDLERYLRDQLALDGLLRPSITVGIDDGRADVVRADVVVTPGPTTSTRRLVLEGVTAIPEPELRRQLSERVAIDAAWVDPAPLTAAVAALYAERGFAAARVEADPVVFDGTTAELRVRVVEGPQSVLKEIVTTGIAEQRRAAAVAAIGLQAGEPLLPGAGRVATRRLERFYLDLGFRAASVTPTSTAASGGSVTLTFTVVEGPLSLVTAVSVTGLEATSPGVADRAITLRPGSPASDQEVADTQRRLYGLGVFRRADVQFEPAPAVETSGSTAGAQPALSPVNTAVALQETRRFQLHYGVQVSNQYGPVLEDFTSAIGVAADIRDRNFLGRAFTLGASTRVENNLQSLRGQFSLPPLVNQRLQTNLFGTIRTETDTSDAEFSFIDKQRNVTFEQRWRARRYVELSWGYSYDLHRVGLASARSDDPVELDGGSLASLNGTVIFDTRDQPFDASRGWFQSSNVQWGLRPLGSDLDYLRVLLRQFYYRQTGPVVLASGVRWGAMRGFSGKPPLTVIESLFTAGGAQTVRGYQQDSLSAIEIGGAPVGGTKVLLLNQEVRFPVFRLLTGAAFVDAGNTFAPGSAISLSRLAVGVGAGLRIITPLAPIRVDFGFPLDRRPEDRRYRVHFSIGQIF